MCEQQPSNRLFNCEWQNVLVSASSGLNKFASFYFLMDYTPPEKSRQPIHIGRLGECKENRFGVHLFPSADIILLKPQMGELCSKLCAL